MAKRAQINDHWGASFFHDQSGVALLRARQRVLDSFADKPLAPWEIAAMEVTDPALSGEGFYRASAGSDLEHYATTDRARFVLQRQGDQLFILSAYPVPHRPNAKRRAA
jgi:hypothetical protein